MTSRQIKDLIRNQAKKITLTHKYCCVTICLNGCWKESHFQNTSGTLF